LQFHHHFGSRSKLLGQILFFLAAVLAIAPCKSAPPTSRETEFHALIWQDADAEFSFEFEYASPKGFRLTSYLIGPR